MSTNYKGKESVKMYYDKEREEFYIIEDGQRRYMHTKPMYNESVFIGALGVE